MDKLVFYYNMCSFEHIMKCNSPRQKTKTKTKKTWEKEHAYWFFFPRCLLDNLISSILDTSKFSISSFMNWKKIPLIIWSYSSTMIVHIKRLISSTNRRIQSKCKTLGNLDFKGLTQISRISMHSLMNNCFILKTSNLFYKIYATLSLLKWDYLGYK